MGLPVLTPGPGPHSRSHPGLPVLPLFRLGSPQEYTQEAPHLSWREPRLTPLAGGMRKGLLNLGSRSFTDPIHLQSLQTPGPGVPGPFWRGPFPCPADAQAVPFHWGGSNLDQPGPKIHPSDSLGRPGGGRAVVLNSDFPPAPSAEVGWEPRLKTSPKAPAATHPGEGAMTPSPAPACLTSSPFPAHIRADPQVGAGRSPPALLTAGPALEGTEPASRLGAPAPSPPHWRSQASWAGEPVPPLTHLEGKGGGRRPRSPEVPASGGRGFGASQRQRLTVTGGI